MARRKILVWTILLLVGAVACFVGLIVLAFLGDLGPPLSTERSGSSIIVHVETLGEYPTTIRHLRIVEAESGRPVLDLVAKSEFADTGQTQVLRFSLLVGQNSTHLLNPEIDSYNVRVPRTGKNFKLQAGVLYKIRAWNSSWIPSTRKFKF